MKVLVIGSGGREHAIVTSVAKSPRVDKIYCAPGNAGIAALAECVPIGAMEFDKLVAFAKEKSIDFTIVGMDDPLVGGIVDVFEAEGLKVFGPRKNAAILEGSKAFSKDLMKKYHIPTAAYENFTDPEEALKYLETAKMPIVLKADGLALGKGVLICNTLEEAKEGVRTIMEDKKFGNAGNTMVIEEFMTGREVSVLSFVDGKTIRTMTSAQDHKRAQDGDQGLNTGGMGTFSPSPFYTEEVDEFCRKYVYQPTVDAMAAEGRPFKGSMAMGWKRMLLRAFWAKIASTAAVYAIAKVFQSWLLAMDDYPCLAEGVDCYNTVPIRIGRNATVSQRAFLCTSGHDITDSRYHQTNASIVIEDRAWVCAEAFVGQGVTAGEGAVCAARAVVIKDVESWTVVGGESGKVYKEKDVNKYQQDTLVSYFI